MLIGCSLLSNFRFYIMPSKQPLLWIKTMVKILLSRKKKKDITFHKEVLVKMKAAVEMGREPRN